VQQPTGGEAVSYTLKTVADVPYGTYPPYPQGPAIVQNDGWQTSITTGKAENGARISAFKVISNNPWKTESHALDGTTFPNVEEAQQAEYNAGLIAYMVYDNSPWATEPEPEKVTYYQVRINGTDDVTFLSRPGAECDPGWKMVSNFLDMLLGGWIIEYFRSKHAIGYGLVGEGTYLAISNDWDAWHYLDGRDMTLPYEITLPALNPRLKERHVRVTQETRQN
jgi:hypothetical protein